MSERLAIEERESVASLAGQIRTVLSRLKRQLREQGSRGDLTLSQLSVLTRLESRGAATVSGLARAEGMRPQSMSSIVTSLQVAGLVNCSADPNDARQTLLSLSRKCEKLLRKTRAARQDWLVAAIGERLSTQERKKLASALELLGQLTEDASSASSTARASLRRSTLGVLL